MLSPVSILVAIPFGFNVLTIVRDDSQMILL